MIRAIAIDDEVPALQVVESFANRTGFIEIEKTFNKPGEALKYLRNFPADLLFLDINMPSINGIDFYKAIQQDVIVIFTTAYSEYAVEGFNLSAVDYLLKPFTYRRFLQAAEKAKEYLEYTRHKKPEEAPYIFIRADYSLVKLNIADIIYIEGYDDYLKIHSAEQKTLVVRMTLKSILEKLPPNDFVRIHRSYVVPVGKINTIRSKSILIGELTLPIGNSYEDEFLKRLNK